MVHIFLLGFLIKVTWYMVWISFFRKLFDLISRRQTTMRKAKKRKKKKNYKSFKIYKTLYSETDRYFIAASQINHKLITDQF